MNLPQDFSRRFPPAIDNTIIEAFFACEGKGMLQFFEHWAPQSNHHLHAGASFAKGIEVTRKAYHWEGKTDDEAIAEGMLAAYQAYGMHAPPPNSNKTFSAVGRAVADYFCQYPLAEDAVQPYTPTGGKPAVEFNFAIPLPINNPDTGEPLLYAGRSDMIGVYNGAIFVVDEKTTSALGPSWERQWDMAGQFTGYAWAARQHGYPVAGAIIRGISFLKDRRFGHAQVPSPRSSYQIEFWYEELLKKVRRMVEAYTNNDFMWSHGAACKVYGGCAFQRHCTAAPEQKIKVLEVEFVKRKWDPLHVGADE